MGRGEGEPGMRVDGHMTRETTAIVPRTYLITSLRISWRNLVSRSWVPWTGSQFSARARFQERTERRPPDLLVSIDHFFSPCMHSAARGSTKGSLNALWQGPQQ